MPRTLEIICDGCGQDLTTTGNCVDYRLCLENEGIPSRGGIVTAMAAYPALERDAYFCDMRCLLKWIAASPGYRNEIIAALEKGAEQDGQSKQQ